MPLFAVRTVAMLLVLVAALSSQTAYALDWSTVTGDGKFTVQIPGAPKEETNVSDTEIGKVPTHIYLSGISADVVYGLFYSDIDKAVLTPTTTQKFLEGGQRGATERTKTTLRSSQQVQLGRWPGLSFVADNAQIVYTSRAYLVDNRLYQLVVVTAKGKADDRTMATFFDSFSVTDK